MAEGNLFRDGARHQRHHRHCPDRDVARSTFERNESTEETSLLTETNKSQRIKGFVDVFVGDGTDAGPFFLSEPTL